MLFYMGFEGSENAQFSGICPHIWKKVDTKVDTNSLLAKEIHRRICHLYECFFLICEGVPIDIF